MQNYLAFFYVRSATHNQQSTLYFSLKMKQFDDGDSALTTLSQCGMDEVFPPDKLSTVDTLYIQ
jgi:hypothetical protein